MAKNFAYGFVWDVRSRACPMLLNAARRRRNEGWLLPGIRHNYWVFDYSISPYGRYKVGARSSAWHERLAQVGHLYPPHVPYTEDLRKAPKPIEDAWVIFTGGAEIGLRKLIPRGCLYARFVDPEGLCRPLIEKVARIGNEEGRTGFWKAQAVLCEILGLLTTSRHMGEETYRIDSGHRLAQSSSWRVAVENHLQTHCSEPMRLAEIARKFNVSVSTLCHRYQSETGESPINARLRMRIEHAKHLLLKGQTLKTIAEETGFCDPYHLSKTFKHLVGIPPRQFIESLSRNLKR